MIVLQGKRPRERGGAKNDADDDDGDDDYDDDDDDGDDGDANDDDGDDGGDGDGDGDDDDDEIPKQLSQPSDIFSFNEFRSRKSRVGLSARNLACWAMPPMISLPKETCS